MVLYLGIDGGGTTCRARLADETGRVLGEGRAGPANTRLGLDAVFAEIAAATEAALAAAGLAGTPLSDLRAGLGLAGLTLNSEAARLAPYPHPFAVMIAESDAHTACLGAHEGGDGAILITGTGTCGCALEGSRRRLVGGWGFEVGDQASGAWIGHQACRQTLLVHDGIISGSALSDAIMAQFDDDPEGLVNWASRARPRDFGGFVPQVFSCAAEGDEIALDIVRQAAAQIAALMARLSGPQRLKIAHMGGVADPIRPYLDAETRDLLIPARGDALAGALRLAGCPLPAASMG